MTQENAAKDLRLRLERARVMKDERREQGMSQATLASLTGLSRTYIGYLETGKRGMSETTLRKIAAKLGIPAAKLRSPDAELWRAA